MSHIWVNPYLLELEFLPDGDTVYVDADGGGTVCLPISDGTGGVTLTYDGEHIMTMEGLKDVVGALDYLKAQVLAELGRQEMKRGMRGRQ